MKRSAAVVALVLGLAACGDGAGPSTTTPPTPVAAAPVRTVIAEGSGPVPSRVLAAVTFSIDRVGALDFTVDWTAPNSLVVIYVVRGACTFERFVAGQCTVLLVSETVTPKPKRLQLPAAAPSDSLL